VPAGRRLRLCKPRCRASSLPIERLPEPTMRCPRNYWIACAAFVFLIASSSFAQAPVVQNLDVLEKLKDFDSLYESGFAVAGTRQSKDDILVGALWLAVNRRWKLTFAGDRVAYLMEAINYENPKYQQPKHRGRIAKKTPPTAKDETLRIAVRTKQWGYWGRDLSGNHYEDTVLAVTPAGKVTETGKMHNSSLFAPRDEGPGAPRRVILWSLGRFFSGYLDKVTQVEKSPDGRLVIVTAFGRKDEAQKGTWQLEIDPTAAWMVRKATFYWDRNPKQVNVGMKNDGTVWSGSYCIPKAAVCNHWGPIGENHPREERLTFEPVVEKFDQELYGDARQAVADNRTPTLTIHDYRVSPPSISEPFRQKPAPMLPAKPGKKRSHLLVVGLLASFVVLFALWMRRRNRQGGMPH
jgi:hypothetical protein